MIIRTNISWDYFQLLDAFFLANNLTVKLVERTEHPFSKVNIEITDNDTELAITFMSTKHLGFENMLTDYLVRCGVAPEFVSQGTYREPRDMKKVENDWEVYRKEVLGFK